MDFSFTEEQRALAALAGQIFSDKATLVRLKAIEQSEERIDREVWEALAKAGILGASLPEEHGGSGGGLLDACLVLVEQGKRVPMVPIVWSVVAGAMTIARFGTADQKERWLSGVAPGATILTAALTEANADPRAPETRVLREGAGFRLDGRKLGVPYAQLASAILVPATTPDGNVGVFLVDPQAPGVTFEPQQSTSYEPQARMELRRVGVGPAALVGSISSGRIVLDWIVDRTMVALCAIVSGACQEAVRLTAEYASNRKQFDKPIAMFQAVGQRMADSFIDNEAVALTMWQAASLLHEEAPATKEVTVAKYWAAEGGSRIGHAGLHIHGGISIDVDYPIHRYFLWMKQIENTLGAATPELARLGAMIAAAD
ncbi:MAG: acyl-CoA dehydrogenase family protein [Candidatus Binatia bacterium]